MQTAIRKFLYLLLCLTLLFTLSSQAFAQEESEATDITAGTRFSGTGYDSFAFLTDKNIGKYQTSGGNTAITLENDAGLAGLYLLFDQVYGAYAVTNNDTGAVVTVGAYGFLHDFLDLDALFEQVPSSVTLQFSTGKVSLSEIRVFSPGTPPQDVQVWDPPVEKGADLVLFSTHGDDDQLYFAGMLPYYAGELGYRVQVVYMTDHRSGSGTNKVRMHEMLNGLWNVGVTAYPVFGNFADFRIDSKEGTYEKYQNSYGVTESDIQSFVVEQVRRFKPLVAVGHDLKGEYGHGMHQVYSDLLTKALTLSNDPAAFPESAAAYGTWDIPKLYLHLYGENTITMDYDQPLNHFDGMTAFEVTQKLGFPAHASQVKYFGNWLYGHDREITQATQIRKYNPCKFGLYRSLVGEDVVKTDLFENITTYAEQERLEQERLEKEEQERLEQERLEQERLEQERLEQERLEKEEQERLEQERLEKEEQERLEQERLEQEAQAKRKKAAMTAMIALCAVAVFLVILLIRLLTCRKNRK